MLSCRTGRLEQAVNEAGGADPDGVAAAAAAGLVAAMAGRSTPGLAVDFDR
jgi:hypothetical protein